MSEKAHQFPETQVLPDPARQAEVGQTIATLLHSDLIETVHAAEKISSRSIADIRMAPGQTVHFSTLEHYNPEVSSARSREEAHPVPEYLSDIFKRKYTPDTYKKTTEKEGWSNELFDQVFDYLKTDPDGAKLVDMLGITYLDDVTAEQAVKLSVGIVQQLSKYSYDQVNMLEGASTADKQTVMELLKAGRDHQGDREWTGNGVCRNISASVAAVFDSLKAHQKTQNRLANTYVLMSQGIGGDGYDTSFNDPNSTRPIGHAWNTFVTLGSNGSANVTIADTTNALDKELHDNDVTLRYMAREMRALFEQSTDKPAAFEDLTYYYKKLAQNSLTKGPMVRESTYQFIATEYLAAAEKVVDELPFDDIDPIPSEVYRGVRLLADKVDESYMRTLYKLSEKGRVESFDQLLKHWANSDTSPTSLYQKISFIERSPESLRAATFQALGPEKSAELATRSKSVATALEIFKTSTHLN